MPTAIEIQGLGKQYQLGGAEAAYQTFREALTDAVLAPLRRLRRLGGQDRTAERIWALKGVSFAVGQGEVVGIIGRNGAGKSTLLKVLSRITEPTEGRVLVRGRLASLLEVGTGFHPELTGRENIFLNGAILGMRQAEIQRKFDEIVAFAEVEKFLDTPVKRYSSGMYVRLAFAVAAHLEPDILVVDEVLAVGDADFQKKCIGKMGSVSREGRTVLFVSHNMGAVQSLCDRAVVLDAGAVVFDGAAGEAIEHYESRGAGGGTGLAQQWPPEWGPGCDDLRLTHVLLTDEAGRELAEPRPDQGFQLRVGYGQFARLNGLRLVFQLIRHTGEIAFQATDQSARHSEDYAAGHYESRCTVPGGLLNTGRYRLRLWLGIYNQRYLVEPFEAGAFTVAGEGNQGVWQGAEQWPGAVCPRLDWSVRERGD